MSDIPQKSFFRRVNTLVDSAIGVFETASLAVAGLSLLGIMILIFIDATLRYTLNRPLTFTVDLVTLYLLSTAMLLVLSDTLRRGGHVNVDIFSQMLPKSVQNVTVGVALLFSNIAVGTMAYQVILLTREAWIHNETMVGIVSWPMWLSKAVVAIGLAVLFLRILHIGVVNIAAGLLQAPALAIPISHQPNDPGEEGI
jgi:TRAP-type C4-dicarboxylate transport system permease small subunit